MSELNLPSRLTTESDAGQETLAVDLQGKVDYSPEEVDRLAKDLGHTQITGARLRALHDLGLTAEQLGVIRTLKGGVITSAVTVVEVIGFLGKLIEDPETKTKEKLSAASVLASVTNAFTKLATGSVKMDTDIQRTVLEVDRVKRNKFQPGVRFHQPAPINV